MTLNQTRSILAAIASVYPIFEATRERVTVWHDLLQEQDYEHILWAAKNFMQTPSAYPPLPGQLIQAAIEHRRAARQQRRVLPPRKPREESPEKLAENKRKFRALLEELWLKKGWGKYEPIQ